MHERIMSNPETRRAYFRPVEGFLRAKPSHPDTSRIVAVLDGHGIYYLHQRETTRPRPTFYWGGIISIGLAEITDAARRLAAAREADSPTAADSAAAKPSTRR